MIAPVDSGWLFCQKRSRLALQGAYRPFARQDRFNPCIFAALFCRKDSSGRPQCPVCTNGSLNCQQRTGGKRFAPIYFQPVYAHDDKVFLFMICACNYAQALFHSDINIRCQPFPPA
jgi:hypothetical protein